MVWGGIFPGRVLTKINADNQRKVAEILRLSMVDKIDFVLVDEEIEVNPRKLRLVADAIEQGRIHVSFGSTGPLLAAAYSPHSNTMSLKSIKVTDSGMGRSDIVHESTHALVDMFKYTKATELSDEVAAYLAQAIFMRAIGLKVTGGDGKAIFDAAVELMDKFKLGQGKKVKLKRADYQALRDAVHANDAYSGIADGQLTSGHGIPD